MTSHNYSCKLLYSIHVTKILPRNLETLKFLFKHSRVNRSQFESLPRYGLPLCVFAAPPLHLYMGGACLVTHWRGVVTLPAI